MNAGALKKKITIQSLTTSRNTYGEETSSAVTFLADVWANVKPLAGREFFASRQFESVIDVQFLIRYTTGITERMRVFYDDKAYNIVSVINTNEEDRELQLMCNRINT